MTSVLIIGGTGFLGANLALGLAGRGHRVILAGTRPLPAAFPAAASRIEVLPARLTDRRAMEDALSTHRPGLVIHMASSLTPGSAADQFRIERRDVVEPTFDLVDRLTLAGIPLVYMSSGGAIYGHSEGRRLNEDDPCNPVSLYGLSKLEVENYVRFAGRVLGLSYLILRPSNPYGRFQPLNRNQGLVSVTLRKLLHDEPLEVWGDGSTVRDYIHVDDFVSAACDLIAQRRWNVTINIGSGVGHSLLDVVRAAERATGGRLRMSFKPRRDGDVDGVVLDVSRLVGLGAWHDRPLDAGISDYAEQLGYA